jgi:hypothetical protein
VAVGGHNPEGVADDEGLGGGVLNEFIGTAKRYNVGVVVAADIGPGQGFANQRGVFIQGYGRQA